jgi:hypothetical protein
MTGYKGVVVLSSFNDSWSWSWHHHSMIRGRGHGR